MCLSDIKDCSACTLCNNQKPLLDLVDSCDGFWVGLSAKMTKFDKERPLDPNTKSGNLLSIFEDVAQDFTMYRTNLVKCVPINDKKKLRYPNANEINACLHNLEVEIDELNPRVIFLLGKKVEEAVSELYSIKFTHEDGCSYRYQKCGKRYFVSMHHPSYIQVYKRKQISEYIKGIEKIFSIVC